MHKRLGRAFLVITALLVLVGLSSGCKSFGAASISSDQQTTVASQIITETPVPAETNSSDTTTATLPPASTTPVTKYNIAPFVREGTDIPLPQEVISRENISQITELARWGYGSINQIEYAPDASLMLVQTDLGLYAYKTGTMNEVWRFESPSGASSMAISPESQSVAVGTHDGTIYLLSLEKGNRIQKWAAHQEKITSLGFSSDSGLLVSGTENGFSAIWKNNDNVSIFLHEIQVSEYGITRVNFSSNDQLLVFTTNDYEYGEVLFFWDMDKKELIDSIEAPNIYTEVFEINEFTLEGDSVIRLGNLVKTSNLDHGTYQDEPISYAFSSDGSLLALGYYETGSARVFRVEDGQLLYDFNSNPADEWGGGSVESIAFSPDNEYLAIKNSKGIIEIWSLINGALLGTEPSSGTLLKFSPDGKNLVSYGYHHFEVIRIPYTQEIGYVPDVWNSEDIQFSPDGNYLVQKGSTFLAINGSKDLRLNYGEWFLDYSIDGESFFTISPEWIVRTRSINDWYILSQTELSEPDEETQSAWGYYGVGEWTISPDGHLIRCSIWDSPSAIWSLPDGGFIRSDSCYSCISEYSPDSKYFASSNGNVTHILQLSDNGDQIIYSLSYPDISPALAFSPDSRYFATNHNSGENNIIHIVGLDPVNEFDQIAIPKFINNLAIAFSPDSSLMAYSVENGIYIWGMKTKEPIYSYRAHFDDIISLAFSPDGTLLASKAFDGSIRFWGIPPG